ncbi:hypothetical protein NDU88_004613 [Pleurodeles waltl]|uniref:Uncharacterized protein n=1 Tax=Pleurodeles waltl TaxID=8319 RepID=A0AAV7MTY9_PLEWA|nr:hypothetical protein NDU88_004613 [Pleurodeles waltl]
MARAATALPFRTQVQLKPLENLQKQDVESKVQCCDGPTLASDPPYPRGARSIELPDPEALATSTNPEVLQGTKGQKRNTASDPGEQEDSEEPETTGTPMEMKAVGGEDDDGPVDGTQAGRQRGGEDRRQYSKTTSTPWEVRGLHRCVARIKAQ